MMWLFRRSGTGDRRSSGGRAKLLSALFAMAAAGLAILLGPMATEPVREKFGKKFPDLIKRASAVE